MYSFNLTILLHFSCNLLVRSRKLFLKLHIILLCRTDFMLSKSGTALGKVIKVIMVWFLSQFLRKLVR